MQSTLVPPLDTLEVLCSNVLKFEQVVPGVSGCLRNDHRVGLGYDLEARRKIRCLADDCLLLRSPEPIRSPTTTNPVAMPTQRIKN